MLNLAEYRKRPAALADYLPWAALVAPGVVLNKDGSFQRSARFRGPDLESATEAELVGTCARLNNVLRRFGSNWALFFEAERHEAHDYPSSAWPDPVSWLVDQERRAMFEQDGSVVIRFSSEPEEGNWLYTPGGKMAILIRAYQSDPEKIGSYIPPAFEPR